MKKSVNDIRNSSNPEIWISTIIDIHLARYDVYLGPYRSKFSCPFFSRTKISLDVWNLWSWWVQRRTYLSWILGGTQGYRGPWDLGLPNILGPRVWRPLPGTQGYPGPWISLALITGTGTARKHPRRQPSSHLARPSGLLFGQATRRDAVFASPVA